MARFAGQALQVTPAQQKPVLPGFNTEDLKVTPELEIRGPQRPGTDLLKDKYIRHNPASGVAQSSIEGKEVAVAPAVAAGLGILGKGLKIYGATKFLDGGRTNPGTRADYAGQDPTAAPGSTSSSKQRAGGGLGRIITDMGDGKKESLRGPTLRSPYHQ